MMVSTTLPIGGGFSIAVKRAKNPRSGFVAAYFKR